MEEIIMRNMEAAQYIYAAKKKFFTEDRVSNSDSKILIGHFSDIHSDIKRFENAIKYFEYFGTDFAIHTGDTVKWNMEDDYKFFENGNKKTDIPLYNCIGNHETFNDTGKTSNAFLHRELLSQLENIVAPDERGYYYVDFEQHKLRLIVLNNYDYDFDETGANREAYIILQGQCDFLVNALKGAAENNFGVIIASHESDIPIEPNNGLAFCQRFKPQPWGKARLHRHVVADIVDAFKHGKEIKLDFVWDNTNERVCINDRFDECGEFICYLNGHRHGDYVGFLSGFPDQLSIGMTCSGCYPEGYHNIGDECSDLPRIPDTVTEDAINFYTIDRERKTISMVRVGACVNDKFEERRIMQINYEGE